MNAPRYVTHLDGFPTDLDTAVHQLAAEYRKLAPEDKTRKWREVMQRLTFRPVEPVDE